MMVVECDAALVTAGSHPTHVVPAQAGTQGRRVTAP